jgi:hypothetical protein
VAPQSPLQLCSHEHEHVITITIGKKIVDLLISCKTQNVLFWLVESLNTYEIKEDMTYA